jgi:G3E family GTPase
MHRTAVVLNELGAIGLDHDLVECSDESFVQLSNGCLCCNVRNDLTMTLQDIAHRRAAGALPRFERVVVETSGLADPAPILHALMTARELDGLYVLDGVVTVVDAVVGSATLDRHEESRRQVAVADRIVLAKTDVDGAATAELRRRLARLNPGAPVLEVVRGDVAPAGLFGAGPAAIAAAPGALAGWLQVDGAGDVHRDHEDDISSVCVVRDRPLHAVTLPLLLTALAENCGEDLLRVKGIVHLAEDPLRPAVIHGVQHVYHPPALLDRWPSDDRRTRIVVVGRGIPERWVGGLLDLLDEEVAEVSAAVG